MVQDERKNPSVKLIKTTFLISILRVTGRIVGFLRQMLLASLFGAGALTDVYFVAYQIYSLVAVIFGSGPLQSSTTTTIINIDREKGKAFSAEFVGKILSNHLILSLILVILLISTSSLWVNIVSPGFTNSQKALFVKLSAPILLASAFVSIMFIISAALHARRIFIPHELANFTNSSIVLISLVVLSETLGIFSVALGHLLGGITALLLILFILIRKNLIKLSPPDFKNPQIRKIYSAYTGISLFVIANQIFSVAEKFFASFLESGKITAISLSHMLIGSILYTVISPIILVLHTELSASYAFESLVEFNRKFTKSMNLLLYLMVPITVSIFILSEPIVRLFFHHGKFTAKAVENTVLALKLFSFSFVFQGLYIFLLRGIMAVRSVKKYIVIAVFIWIISIAFMWLSYNLWKYTGILLAYSIPFLSQSMALIWLINSVSKFNFLTIVFTFIKISIAASIAGLSVITINTHFFRNFGSYFQEKIYFLIIIVASIAIFSTIYLFTTGIMGVNYLNDIKKSFSRKP